MLPWLAPSSVDRFADVRDTPLAKLVRDEVLGMILGGALAPGERINEPDIAARLKVSRVPVREALRELESSGLVIARKHSGVFVRELTAPEVRDLYELRGLLDAFAGRRAASLPDAPRAALCDLLDESIARMKASSAARDVQSYYAENLRFHWAIVEAAGNAEFSDAYRGIVQKLHLARLKNLSHDMGMRASITEHAAIARALRKADPARSQALMENHVGDAFARLKIATARAA